MLSRKTDYALRALVYLTYQNTRKVATKKIANKLNIPYKFLTQIFLELVRNGILISERGSKGGVALRKDPAKISFLDIIETVEGSYTIHRCINEVEEDCFFADNCPIKELLCEIEEDTRKKLDNVTLDKINLKPEIWEEK